MFDSDDILHLVGCENDISILFLRSYFDSFSDLSLSFLIPNHMVKKDVTLDSSWFSHLKYIIDIKIFVQSKAAASEQIFIVML